jgi:hypothetical protein
MMMHGLAIDKSSEDVTTGHIVASLLIVQV